MDKLCRRRAKDKSKRLPNRGWGQSRDFENLPSISATSHQPHRARRNAERLGQYQGDLLVGRPVDWRGPDPDLHGIAVTARDLTATRSRLDVDDHSRA